MAARKDQRSPKRPARVEYNLERDPLQSGRRVSLRYLPLRMSSRARKWLADRRMAGALIVLCILLLVLIGCLIAFGGLQRLFDAYFLPEAAVHSSRRVIAGGS